MRVYLYYILLATYIGVAMRTRARVRTYARTSDYFAKNPTIENQYLTLKYNIHLHFQFHHDS